MKQTCLICLMFFVFAGVAAADIVADISNAIKDFSAEDFQTRNAALERLVEIGQPATAQLVKALSSDEQFTALYACKALGRIADPEAKEPLAAVLEESDDSTVRAAAVAALGAYGSSVIDTLQKVLLEDDDIYVRKTAVIVVASFESKAAIDLLVWLLKSDSPELRQLALKNLLLITQTDNGTTYEPWKKWWLANREQFEF